MPAAGGDFYVGATALADRVSVDYTKTVDSTHPKNSSSNKGRAFQDQVSATGYSSSYGLLAGYKVPISVTGAYLSLEGDALRHTGSVDGHIAGVGSSTERNQLGDAWPENWSFGAERSFGVTARLGVGIPFFGTWFGPSLYGLAGIRRVQARFSATSTGCLTTTPCSAPDQFVTATERFNESFNGWTVGGGVEQKLGIFAVRGEVRITKYSATETVVPYDDVFVSVALNLQPAAITAGAALVWYF